MSNERHTIQDDEIDETVIDLDTSNGEINRESLFAMELMVIEFVKALRKEQAVNQRWLSIGATQIELGFMAIHRAVADQA